jgi:predicted transcriptional regulator
LISPKIYDKEIAECVGLWLAEGDNTSIAEITLTNNNLEIILFFHEIIKKLYQGKNEPSIYIYSPTPKQLFHSLNNFKKVKFYVDERANRCYYIYRLADRKFVKRWHGIVNKIKINKCLYPEILRGFFAGEGNVKTGSHSSRRVRISQLRSKFIEKILDYFAIKYYYDESHREYEISNRINLERLEEIEVSTLHPEKHSKFKKMIESYKQHHYSRGKFKNMILTVLEKPLRVKDMSLMFDRTESRVSRTLIELRKEKLADYLRVGNFTFWMKPDIKQKLISDEIIRLLSNIDPSKSVSKVAREIGIYRKTLKRKLDRLEVLGFAKRNNKGWMITQEGKKLILGIDEAGNK